MERILDLPAHPLLIHFPAVAIPLLGGMALVLVVVPRFRPQWRLVVIGLSIAVIVTTFLAASSGQALADAISYNEARLDHHRTLGETLRFFVLALGVAVTALVTIGAPDRDRPLGGGPAVVLQIAVVAFAILSVVWAFRTGHEGARIHWEGVLPETEAAESEIATAAAETTAAPTTAPPETTTTTEPTQTTEPTSAVDGMAVYEANCSRCHGSDGSGGRGPSLVGIAEEQPDPQDAIIQTINGGSGMPSFSDKLSEAEIVAAVDYLREAFPAAAS